MTEDRQPTGELRGMCKRCSKLEQLVRSLDSLLACYRLQTAPSDELLDRIIRLRKEVTPAPPAGVEAKYGVKWFDFALSQLREAIESGHLSHLPTCRSNTTEVYETFTRQLPCSCGFEAKWGGIKP